MKIGQFTKLMETTKETVRHYESLDLLNPRREKNLRIYSNKDCQDFEAIKEMKELGLSLKNIQDVFYIKRQQGCGSGELLHTIMERLYHLLDLTSIEIKQLSERKVKLLDLVQALERLAGEV